MNQPNQQLLDEVNAAKLWFAAKKTKPLWAKRIEAEQSVDTLEGTAAASTGDYLCRGQAGDTWPQAEKSLFSKYKPTDETDTDGWRKFLPKPDAAGVFAAQIQKEFTVEAKWGTLTGKPGDYLVKAAADEKNDYPEDVWIVATAIFDGTYERGER